MQTLTDIFPEPQGGRRTGQPVRRYSKTARGAEGRFWRPFDRQQASRYMLAAERFDRVGRMAHRADRNGRHNGPLGHVALDVLRELLRLIDFKTGRLDPAILTIAAKIGRSPAAVVAALKCLKLHGFLDWLRRYEPTGNEGRGPQVRQTSNAYALSLPACALRLLGAAAPPPDDHTHRQEQEARAAFSSSPMGEIFERWGKVFERDSTPQPESPIHSFKTMRNGLRP